jgi:hypothetical protein
MGFASTWLEERALFPEIIHEAPDKKTGIIVVVPSFNEPGICRMLDSLALCSEPDCKVEVIIVVNAPPGATAESLENNKLTLSNIERWKKENPNCFFRLYFFVVEPPVNGWGVGLARKTGMDEAVRRFNLINNPDGIILNLDADCTVEHNYFAAVCDNFTSAKDRSACSIYFEHPLTGSEFTREIYRYITLYELHLRYYFQGLAYSGFPYVFHTVGSASAVKALPYIKAGGMNRKQAGEDFYFIQKLVPLGGYFSLNTTVVYPSPRPSLRVPFGTGATIDKLTKESSSFLLTYNFLAFKELRKYFGMADDFYNSGQEELNRLYEKLPDGIRQYLGEDEWINKLIEIKNNTSGILAFKKRFFGWFNMFRIVKYLNFVHQNYFEKRPVEASAIELLVNTGSEFKSKDPTELLLHYRFLEKH